ncbi:MAG: hypothetical protein CMH31_01610 [Micavibrio sp.]|nr:hypothetical protein [Micavibrio sp.]
MSLRKTKRSAAIHLKNNKHRLLRHFVPRNDVTSENGSVILWILIAVGLMAALSYAFMGSSRNSTSMITDVQAEAYANEIIAYGNELKSAVKRLQLRGCSDTEISFENNVVSGYTNPNSPTDNSCHVFDIAGGGVNLKEFGSNIFDTQWQTPNLNYGIPFFISFYGVDGIGKDCTNESCSELTFMISDLKLKVCQHINKTLLISEPSGDGITNYWPQYFTPSKFTGGYIYTNTGSLLGNIMTGLSGKSAGCFLNVPDSKMIPTFYQVIIAR